MPNTFLTLKNVREQRDQLHLHGIPLPYTQPHWLQFGTGLCNQNSTLGNRDGTKMQAFLFACILRAAMEKHTGRSGKLLSRVNSSPGSGWTSWREEVPNQSSSDTETARARGEGGTDKQPALPLTPTFSSQAAALLPLLGISSFYVSSQTSGQRRRVSSCSSCVHKNHILLKAKWKIWTDRQKDRKH